LLTRDLGFQLQGASSNNKVLYLDSYGNRDPRKNGESADGFACKEGSGEGNLLKGARLWNNVDDGLDLWEFKSAVTIEDTISWGNGYNRYAATCSLVKGNAADFVDGVSPPSKATATGSNSAAETQRIRALRTMLLPTALPLATSRTASRITRSRAISRSAATRRGIMPRWASSSTQL
jgi:hypothetical protein